MDLADIRISGPGGRRFKSSLPDHSFSRYLNRLPRLCCFGFCPQFSVHSVQLMATRTQIHTDLPSSAEHRVLFDLVIEVAHVLPRLTHPALVQAPQDIPYSSAGKCAENDGTHGFRLCAFQRTDSRSSLASRILRDSSLGDYNDHDDHMVTRGIR